MCIKYGEKYDCEKLQLNVPLISYIVIMLMYNLVYCLNCSNLFALLIMVEVYGMFLQKVLEKLLRYGI